MNHFKKNKQLFDSKYDRLRDEYLKIENREMAFSSDRSNRTKGLYFSNVDYIESGYGNDDNSNIELIVLEEGIKEIKDRAFYNHKCSELIIPQSVLNIGDDAISSESIRYLELPIHLSYALRHNYMPYLDEFHFKDDRIICKASRDDFNPEIHCIKPKIFIECAHFDLRNIPFETDTDFIEFVHIGKDVLDIDTFNADPLYVKRAFVDKRNPIIRKAGRFIIDKGNNISFVIYKKRVIEIDSSITYVDYLPSIPYLTPLRYDASNNHNFITSNGIIWNSKKRVIYIPDDKEVGLTDCGGFAHNLLVNHSEIEKLIIYKDSNDSLNPMELHNMLSVFLWALERNRFRNNPLTIVLPTNKMYSVFSSFACDDLKIVFDDIESPDCYME